MSNTILKFLVSSTQKAFLPQVETADIAEVSESYNSYMVFAVESGFEVSKTEKIEGALVTKISNGTEIHIITDKM